MAIVVNSLWISSKLGRLQRMCIQSFINHGHEFHLYTYNDVQNLPSNVIIKDANLIIPRHCIFLDVIDSYATFSDWFRVKLLNMVGGWWVDADVFCIRPFDIPLPYVFATERAITSENQNVLICNAVIKLPKNASLSSDIANIIEASVFNINPKSIGWTEIGAKLLRTHIFKNNLSKFIMKPDVFCPIAPFDFQKAVIDDNSVFSDVTFGVHLWNKMWEMNNLNYFKSDI